MKHCRRIFSIVLALGLTLSTLTGCGTSKVKPEGTTSAPVPITESVVPNPPPAEEPKEPTLDDELQRAQKAGFILDGWLKDMDAPVTFQEYSAITTRFIELWDESRVDEWKEIVKLASEASDEMKREDGFLMLSYAWVMMGYSHDHVSGYIDENLQPEYDIWRDPELINSQMKELSWEYAYFPDGADEKIVYDIFGANYIWGAVCTFPDVMSPVSGKMMFEFDENKSLRLQAPFTRDDAIRSIVRMADYCQVELDPNWRDYISIAEAGTYDRDIITDELLNRESNLPEVKQDKLPTAWKGSGLSVPKNSSGLFHLHFREADIRFLAENGFNFTRLFFDFETLRYPDYPEAWDQINQCELKDLDQLLAWCIKYGVHLQISMIYYQDVNGNSKRDSAMPVSEAEWQVTRSYWEMLAKRYAGISSKYLSFDLCNEIEPLGHGQPDELDFNTAIEGISSVRDVIWNADPERVLLYSFAGNPPEESVDAIAALGIAIGCHSYIPGLIATAQFDYTDTNPYAEVTHPQPVFPMGQICDGHAPLTITGAISGCKLSFHIWTSDNQTSAEIFADGELLETIRIDDGVPGDNGDYYYGDTLYSTDIPEGTKQIDLWIRNGYARPDTIIIEGNGQKVTMMPSDTCDFPDRSDPLPLVVNSDGTYANSEGTAYDMDLIYEKSVKAYHSIAQKYSVGFMVNEFGCFGTGVYWDIDPICAYHEEMLNMMEKYDLGWCYCETYNIFPKHLIILFGNQSQWKGSTVEDITYDFSDHVETIKVCKELLETFRKHTLKE